MSMESREKARGILRRLPDHICLALENHQVLLKDLQSVDSFRRRLRRVLESSTEVGDALHRIFKLFDHYEVDIRNEQEKAERSRAEKRRMEKRSRHSKKSAFLDLGAEEGSEEEDQQSEIAGSQVDKEPRRKKSKR